MFDSILYIPCQLRVTYLQRCHEGHQGIEKCAKKARELFWWPSVGCDIDKYITQGASCVKANAVKHGMVFEHYLPICPWEEVETHVFAFESELYLVVIDYYSKWMGLSQLSAQTARNVVVALRVMFSRRGIPSKVRSDNECCFASEEFCSFAKEVLLVKQVVLDIHS